MIHQSEGASVRLTSRITRAAPPIPVDDGTAYLAADIFDRLFGLLKRRLWGMTLEWRDEPAGSADHAHLGQMNARLFECAAALDHIHAALGPDIARMSQIERELRLTRAVADQPDLSTERPSVQPFAAPCSSRIRRGAATPAGIGASSDNPSLAVAMAASSR